VRTAGLRFDVNCSILFTELPLLKRPGAARAAGFGAVEFWWPFTAPVPADREVAAFTGALADAGVQLALLNFAGGDTAAGDRGLLALPEGSAAFRELDYEALFGQLARQGYAGWIGCEYKPADPADSSTSFGWKEPDEV
jgi:hydroxypyruvate isomerase